MIDCMALATGGKDSCAIEIAQTDKTNRRITRIFRIPYPSSCKLELTERSITQLTQIGQDGTT